MLSFQITERGATPKLAIRALNDIQREVAEEMGEYWHKHFRAKHFTHRGASEYGYTPRSPRYEAIKLRTKGHTYPLVNSGLSEALTRIRDVRATATKGEGRVRVLLHAPALNFRPRGGRIDLRDEMTRMSEPEGTEIAAHAGREQTIRFNRITETTTTTKA